MDMARHVIALMIVVLTPGLLLYWLMLHPWAKSWRRLGATQAMTLLWSIVFGVAAGLGWLAAHGHWLSADWGFHPVLFGLGLVSLAVSAWLRRQLALQFSFRALSGLPELAPERYPQKLVTGGIYGRMRHPRYLQLLIALTGWSLLANHPASYLATALWVPGMWIIARLEERELRERFGREYEEYCRTVPRFFGRGGR